jgi:hypothetical protein
MIRRHWPDALVLLFVVVLEATLIVWGLSLL